MKLVKKISIFIFVFMSLFLFSSRVSAASFDIYTAKAKCPVRSEPSDKSSIIKSGNDDVRVFKNQEVEYISTKKGPNNGLNNQDWYEIKFDYAAREYKGYVARGCMYDKKTYSYNDDTNFEASISSFPNSYKPYLRKMHARHPNWNFISDITTLDWETVAEAESQKGTSAIPHTYPSLRFRDETNPNGIIVDGNSWYAPAKDAVKYYLDPRNFNK